MLWSWTTHPSRWRRSVPSPWSPSTWRRRSPSTRPWASTCSTGARSPVHQLRGRVGLCNLQGAPAGPPSGALWGRVVLWVDDVDAMYRRAVSAGFTPLTAADAPWGERYFHLRDPAGHELSFARPRDPTTSPGPGRSEGAARARRPAAVRPERPRRCRDADPPGRPGRPRGGGRATDGVAERAPGGQSGWAVRGVRRADPPVLRAGRAEGSVQSWLAQGPGWPSAWCR